MFFCKFRAFLVPLTQTLHRGAYFKADPAGNPGRRKRRIAVRLVSRIMRGSSRSAFCNINFLNQLLNELDGLEHGPLHFSGKYSWPQKAAGIL